MWKKSSFLFTFLPCGNFLLGPLWLFGLSGFHTINLIFHKIFLRKGNFITIVVFSESSNQEIPNPPLFPSLNLILPLIFPQFLAYNRITIPDAVLRKNCRLQTPPGLNIPLLSIPPFHCCFIITCKRCSSQRNWRAKKLGWACGI